MTLTAKQQRFVEEYLVDLNATAAAARAGYSAKTAKEQGYQLLQRPDVQFAISGGQATRSERTKVDADWVLRRLADEADADLAELYHEGGGLKPVHDWPLIWRKGLVAGIEVESLKDEGDVVGYLRKVRLSERIKRLELIGKHLGMFTDKVELGGPRGSPIAVQIIKRVYDDDVDQPSG